MKQPPLPGLALPAQPDIEEATNELREAKEAAKREADRVKAAEAVLIHRMLEAKVPKHRYSANGNYIDVEVTLPAPSVRVRVSGGDGED